MVNHSSSKSLLPTASVLISSGDAAPISCRALLDTGSQTNLACSKVIELCGARTSKAKVKVVGFGNGSQRLEKQACITIKAKTSNYQKTILVLVTDTITSSLPHEDIDINDWDLSHVNLADPEFHLRRPVDLLLGAAVMFDILRDGNTKISKNLPSIQNTALGWIVGGDITRMKMNGEVI